MSTVFPQRWSFPSRPFTESFFRVLYRFKFVIENRIHRLKSNAVPCLWGQIQNAVLIGVFLLLILADYCFSIQQLPPDLHEAALAAIDNVYRENFTKAEDDTKKIIKKYPDHPAGYFFSAVVIDAWMGLYMSKSRENEFYQFCDLAIEKGEAMLDKNRNDEWVKFFVAGADGYKGTYEARYERWITAFRYGWQCVSKLIDMESAKTSIIDINYGIGSYDYWRSAMIKMLWFMPNVDDRRQKGIDRLYIVLNNGNYTKINAAAALVDILLNENRYDEVLKITDEMIKKYPESQTFVFGKAKALTGLSKSSESIAILDRLLTKCNSYTEGDHYMVIVCHFWLAKNYFMQNDYTQAMVECNRMTYHKISGDTKKLLEKYFYEAESIKKQIYVVQRK